jgi:hypothetical protein
MAATAVRGTAATQTRGVGPPACGDKGCTHSSFSAGTSVIYAFFHTFAPVECRDGIQNVRGIAMFKPVSLLYPCLKEDMTSTCLFYSTPKVSRTKRPLVL